MTKILVEKVLIDNQSVVGGDSKAKKQGKVENPPEAKSERP